MRVKLAYLGVVLLWATTPLAIKWSSVGISFILGVSARMTLGLVGLLWWLLINRTALPLNRCALQTYLAVSLQLYASMSFTYWGAQHIPSGWVAVIFGLGPFMTALLAAFYLGEGSLSPLKIASYLLGLGGLALMFHSAAQQDEQAVWGMLAILVATLIQALSAVSIKKIAARLPALQQITGGLLISVPVYWLSWYVLDGTIPHSIPVTTLMCVVYLGILATIFGFAWYYFVLRELTATQVSMINLITPVLSLWLGITINHEPIHLRIIAGTALIVTALLGYGLAERRSPTAH